jgi:hypothetical protein
MRKIVLIVSIMLAGCFYSFAQPGDPASDPDNAVPITGLEWLLIGGGVLGLKKILGNKTESSDK